MHTKVNQQQLLQGLGFRCGAHVNPKYCSWLLQQDYMTSNMVLCMAWGYGFRVWGRKKISGKCKTFSFLSQHPSSCSYPARCVFVTAGPVLVEKQIKRRSPRSMARLQHSLHHGHILLKQPELAGGFIGMRASIFSRV